MWWAKQCKQKHCPSPKLILQAVWMLPAVQGKHIRSLLRARDRNTDVRQLLIHSIPRIFVLFFLGYGRGRREAINLKRLVDFGVRMAFFFLNWGNEFLYKGKKDFISCGYHHKAKKTTVLVDGFFKNSYTDNIIHVVGASGHWAERDFRSFWSTLLHVKVGATKVGSPKEESRISSVTMTLTKGFLGFP